MKITNKILIVLLGLVFVVAACDKVEPPFEKDVVVSGERKVLLEEYTGHMCPNCPGGAKTAHDLSDIYGDKLIVVAVHAGFNANTIIAPFLYDFTCPAGDALDQYFKISNDFGNPNGMVNRKERSGSVVIAPDNWAIAVGDIINTDADAAISITADYTDATRVLDIDLETDFINDLGADTYMLAVVITEDSIIKPQKNSDPLIGPTPTINDYVHMHVLRGAVNGTWGEQIDANITDSKSYQITLDNEWKEKDCHVVAYIYKDSNKEIIQAEEIKVIE